MWECAGLTVRRLPTDRLFADTSTFLFLVHPPNVGIVPSQGHTIDVRPVGWGQRQNAEARTHPVVR